MRNQHRHSWTRLALRDGPYGRTQVYQVGVSPELGFSEQTIRGLLFRDPAVFFVGYVCRRRRGIRRAVCDEPGYLIPA
jgi:hypothetical protein